MTAAGAVRTLHILEHACRTEACGTKLAWVRALGRSGAGCLVGAALAGRRASRLLALRADAVCDNVPTAPWGAGLAEVMACMRKGMSAGLCMTQVMALSDDACVPQARDGSCLRSLALSGTVFAGASTAADIAIACEIQQTPFDRNCLPKQVCNTSQVTRAWR